MLNYSVAELRNMKKNRKKQIVVLCIALVCIFILVFSLSHKSATKGSANPPLTDVLTDSISQIVSACPGEIGVAVIINNTDTVSVNNKSIYPMMSVFKVHQALALCNDFDKKGLSLDTLVKINREKLDPKTWSPMMKDYSAPVISLTVRDLLRYTLSQSDNNASNIMFKNMLNTAQTDSFIAKLIPRSSFQIAYTEEEMSADHDKAYSNYTSPLGAAMLMNRLFTESLISNEKQDFIKNALKECKTGKELINIKTSPKVKKDARRYEYRGKDLYGSEEGILLDAGTDEEFYNSQAMTAGLMTVCWKNGKEKQIQFDPNADVSEYEAADIIVPKVTSTGKEKSERIHCYYALELSDWENIREIKLGENVFAKAENLEKATDDLNKKKKKSKEEKAKEEAEALKKKLESKESLLRYLEKNKKDTEDIQADKDKLLGEDTELTPIEGQKIDIKKRKKKNKK